MCLWLDSLKKHWITNYLTMAILVLNCWAVFVHLHEGCNAVSTASGDPLDSSRVGACRVQVIFRFSPQCPTHTSSAVTVTVATSFFSKHFFPIVFCVLYNSLYVFSCVCDTSDIHFEPMRVLLYTTCFQTELVERVSSCFYVLWGPPLLSEEKTATLKRKLYCVCVSPSSFHFLSGRDLFT